MAVDAFQVMYDQELQMAFQRERSLLENRVYTKGEAKGYQFVFDIFGDASAEATTRGVTGDIVYGQTTNNQVTVTLEQWHAAMEKNQFNIRAAQGNQRAAMQREVMARINRKKDALIINELINATLVSSSAGTMSVDYALKAEVNLMQNNAGGMTTGVITPAAWAYLVQQKEVSSKDYVAMPKFEQGYDNRFSKTFMWNNTMWIVHTGLPGIGTASATCFIFTDKAIGYGYNTEANTHATDYESKHDRTWARSSIMGNAKILQNSGIIKLLHNDTGFAL